MCSIILFITLVLILSHEIDATPISQLLVEVPFGETVTLQCESNDENHTFLYWYMTDRNIIIGPSNRYDNRKFKFEILSGNLTVKAVSKEEEGTYNCASRGVIKDDVNIRSVRMVVEADWEEVYEKDPSVIIF